MGGTTVLPPSGPPHRTAAIADIYSRTPRIWLNPCCMANPDPKNKKPPGSIRGGEPPAKRVHGASPHLAGGANVGKKKLQCPSSGMDPKSSTRMEATVVIEKQSTDSRNHLSGSTTAQPKPSIGCSMRELIERARLAKAAEGAMERSEIERRRSEARRKLEQMVATAEFNDPFIDPEDVVRSPSQLKEARQAAADAQAQIMVLARRREREDLE